MKDFPLSLALKEVKRNSETVYLKLAAFCCHTFMFDETARVAAGDKDVNTYRIPIMTSQPDGSLVALSEGRKPTAQVTRAQSSWLSDVQMTKAQHGLQRCL